MNAIRTQLDESLATIREQLLWMNDTVAERIDLVTTALLQMDIASADALIAADDEIDLVSQEVEERCIETLIRESPVASDLREIVAAMHMNGDIERSGDLTTNIAKAAGRLQGIQVGDRLRQLILQMASEAKMLIEVSGQAYRDMDATVAASIDDLDDVLDELHKTFIQMVITEAKHGELLPQQSLQLALIGRFYERIGDHAENVGERIRYIVDGWTPERAGAERARARSSEPVTDGQAARRGLAVIDAKAEERQIDATRRDFVANVSHELKTPVGAISLLAETLADAEDEADRSRLAEHLSREAGRAALIIDDLLELTRLEEFEPKKGREQLDGIVTEVLEACRGLGEARDVAILVGGHPSGVEVDVDRRQVVRALTNLLDNAVRYSESGGEITLLIEDLPEEVDITVKDQGAGIARPELERIFERFYRIDQARSRETGGTGLGLSIVRHVAENHGGRVLVESKPGVGSAFTLRLPTV